MVHGYTCTTRRIEAFKSIPHEMGFESHDSIPDAGVCGFETGSQRNSEEDFFLDLTYLISRKSDLRMIRAHTLP